jgi:Glycosyl transferases group 1/Glycosyltransferase Family 4
MRILHLDAGREMRGGQWQVLRLIRGLAAEGVESTLLAPEGSPLYAAARKEGLHAEPLGAARAWLLARRHHLVHAHDARSHTLGALPGCPLVVSRRVAFPIRSRWKYRRARRYLAVSNFVRRVLMSGGVPEEKISVVYDGVPLLERAEGTAILAPSAQADVAKGTGLALEAARLAGVPLELTRDIERDLARARILVYLTHSEGLGSAALLAMSAGVPVIASNVGGLPEIVRHEETGLLVENDPAEVAAAIRRLADDSALARRLGDTARQAVIRGFSVEHMVRRTMEVYRRVTG